MNIRLNWLRIANFKGINNFTLETGGKNATVYADNGKGKTTLFDAFLWLLFDKDSTDRTAFTVKPQDENGNDIHHLQTEVEAELIIGEGTMGGRSIKLKKMQEEKWTTKRGSDTAELTGNTLSYWWDEVPVKAGEFKQKIAELINENIFRMLTNPMYFNGGLKWQERRKIIFEMCGDMTDEEVIAAEPKLKKLGEHLNGKGIDDFKKVVSDKIAGLKKEKDNIPPRIDELHRSLPQENIDYSATEADIQKHQDIILGIESELTNANTIAESFRKKQQEFYGFKGQLQKLKDSIDQQAGAGRRKLNEEKSELESGKYILQASIKQLEAVISDSESSLELYKKQRETLRDEWRALKDSELEIFSLRFEEPSEDEFNCPTCGQGLPKNSVETKIAELEANFSKNKIGKLSSINQKMELNKVKGIKLKQQIETLEKEIPETKIELEQKQYKLNELVLKIASLNRKLEQPQEQPDYSANLEYKALEAKITQMEAALQTPQDSSAALLASKREVQTQIDNLKATLNQKTVVEATKRRVEELKAEEKRVATQIAELEGLRYLTEQFTTTKVTLLEDKINSHFKFVRFKMFDVQLNGGIADTCEALVNTNGNYVPFADANHAGKVNAGLDVINALGRHYGVIAPIWIDFRESVSRIIPTEAQVINLFKSEEDKVLRVEVQAIG